MGYLVYWIQLLRKLKELDAYIKAHDDDLVLQELPASVYAAFPYIRTATSDLKAFDLERPRGDIDPE